MVNATVDNKPVSIVLDGGQSTTVPSNETWRVSIYLANEQRCSLQIDGIGDFRAHHQEPSSHHRLEDVTLTGNQAISEQQNSGLGAIFITGFVVND